MSRPPPFEEGDSVLFKRLPLLPGGVATILPACKQLDCTKMNCIKLEAFKEVTDLEEYKEIKDRREQIAFLIEHLCNHPKSPDEFFTHQEIAE